MCPPAVTSSSKFDNGTRGMADDNDKEREDGHNANNGGTVSTASLDRLRTKPLIPESVTNKSRLLRYTFHWELNLYSFSVLGLIYYLIPSTHKVIFHVLFALIAMDATRYYYAKGSMHGVPYTLPMVSLIAMIVNPVRFWSEMGYIAMESPDGMCSNVLAGNFMVFISNPQMGRKIFMENDTFSLYAHPNASWLFDPANLIYLDKEPHKRFRAILTPALFSNEALALYAQKQEATVRQYLQKIVQECQATQQPFDARITFRSMAAASSQESFVGPYLTDELRNQLEQDILVFTLGFLSPPIPWMGGLRRALEAKRRIESCLEQLVPKAREFILAGNEPRCLLEHWIVAIVKAAKEQGCEADNVPGCQDHDLARTVLDFLFAAQDATNSALTYCLDVLEVHKDVLHKMRDEVQKECTKGSIATQLDKLSYVAKVSNEMLHHKPPVPMVPHIVAKTCVLGDHTIRKGSVVIPSLIYSAHSSGRSNDFVPEREPAEADTQFVKTIVFGAGQHKCPGRKYAESLVVVFLAVLAEEGYDFYRTSARPKWEDFIYYPTVFPSNSDFMLVKG